MVVINSTLLWSDHVDKISSKISKNIFLLRNLANNLSQEVLKTAYFALIQSHLEYSILVWGHSASSDRLFRLQRRALRIVAGLRYREDCKQYFGKLNIMTLPFLYIYNSLIYIWEKLSTYKSLNSYHNYDTRTCDLAYNYLRLERCRCATNYFGVKFFNKLPTYFRSLSFNQFKIEIKELLIKDTLYSIGDFFK